MEIAPNAMVVLERRYLRKDKDGQVVESPQELFRRVARHIASAEEIYDPQADIRSWEEKFYRIMADLEFLPNSPTLMNAGRELGQLSACFVLPVEDSMESIFDAVKYTALIHKSGGGTGFSFSRLRPERDRVGSTGGVASGPVSFMRAFDAATDVIKQGGMRRGANMAILNVDHPDIMSFITCKENHDVLTNFNISVAVTESFMKAVEQGADYDLINPRTQEVAGRLNAREVFDKMVDMAWRNGDPGLVFLDRINRDNPTPHLGSIESTNPCGEQPLLPYESCNLGSINLSRMIGEEDGVPAIDWEKLARVVKTAVRFLDNVIDMNKFPLPEIEETTKSTRKIGLGVMGFADMLMRLGIPYDSEEALKTGKSIMEFIEKEATAASVELAKERGVFPAFEGSIYDKRKAPRVRNATRTTIAPTGTLSIIANCSSGIEPLFALSYSRNILDGDKLVEVNPLFEEIARKEGILSDELMKALAEQGKVRGIEGIPEWIQQVFVTSHDISPEWHVRMQAAFQRHTNNAVSKTINFPHEATREDVARAYMLAYKEGCKGITIYRDRSREAQVLDIGKEKRPEEKGMVPRQRPDATFGVTEKMTTGCGNLYITVNFDERGICEVFTSLGKSGGCASAQLEAISRLISMSLRAGLSVESLVKHIKGIRCPSIAWDRGRAVLSCADAIGTVLERHLNNGLPQNSAGGPEMVGTDSGGMPVKPGSFMGGQCPDCGGLLVYQEGCHICYGCGYTKCS
ncbi:vitamin B12-dependent ribonucleotide reductase [Dehalococcoidia bacterium]|nr:vitamin B12-dependent ribonucleotide reductase [Dehalococcoidia bacterium]